MGSNPPFSIEDLKTELDEKNAERAKLMQKRKAGAITPDEADDLELLNVDIIELARKWRELRRQRDGK